MCRILAGSSLIPPDLSAVMISIYRFIWGKLIHAQRQISKIVKHFLSSTYTYLYIQTYIYFSFKKIIHHIVRLTIRCHVKSRLTPTVGHDSEQTAHKISASFLWLTLKFPRGWFQPVLSGEEFAYRKHLTFIRNPTTLAGFHTTGLHTHIQK